MSVKRRLPGRWVRFVFSVLLAIPINTLHAQMALEDTLTTPADAYARLCAVQSTAMTAAQYEICGQLRAQREQCDKPGLEMSAQEFRECRDVIFPASDTPVETTQPDPPKVDAAPSGGDDSDTEGNKDDLCNKILTEMDPATLERCAFEQSEPGVKDTPWYISLVLGTQFGPEYNDEGTNQGFNEERFFGAITLDSKWLLGNEKPLHWGIALDFLGQPVVAPVESGMNEGTEGDEQAMNDDSGSPRLPPTDFTDIADAATLSTYFLYQAWQWEQAEQNEEGKPAKHRHKDRYLNNLGPFVRLSVTSREELGENNDSISTWGVVGLAYTFERYKEQGYRNGQPNGFARVGWGVYEDFGGLGSTDGLVVDAGFQLPIKVPMFLSLKALLNPDGPDDFQVLLDWRFRGARILDLFLK